MYNRTLILSDLDNEFIGLILTLQTIKWKNSSVVIKETAL